MQGTAAENTNDEPHIWKRMRTVTIVEFWGLDDVWDKGESQVEVIVDRPDAMFGNGRSDLCQIYTAE